jgi:ligand-binding sensor domain-containing protein
MKLLCPSLIIFLSIICFCIYAQQPDIRFQRLSSKDGLSGDIVYCILQDRKGFLWIGTHRGLNRYDGYHFTHYNYDPYDTNSLSGNHVECIKEDNDGILWLTTNKGLNSLDPATGKIKRYELRDSTLPTDMEDMFSVNDSILLINTRRAIYKFNKKTESFYPIKTPKSIYEFGTVNCARFTKDNSGRIFIATSSKECLMINWKDASSVYIQQRDSLQLMPYDEIKGADISQVYFDSYNNAWAFNTEHGSLLTKINYPYSKDEVADENLINGFYEERGKILWICTGTGLVMYDYTANAFYRYIHEPGNEESISSNRIRCVTKDKNGTYWIGTSIRKC